MPDPKVTTVTREHRAEAARLLGHNPEHWIRHSLYGDWLETGDTSRLNSAMPTVAQALADRDARIGELERSLRNVLGLTNKLTHRLRNRPGYAVTEEELRPLLRFCRDAGFESSVTREAEPTDANDTTKDQLARVVGALDELQNPRPLDEYHEDYGSVLWWLLPVNEPPYVGAPGDSDWPGYHTHWTKCPQLKETEDHD
jgi:hypothetical protein